MILTRAGVPSVDSYRLDHTLYASSSCARDNHSAAIRVHSGNLNIMLSIEIVFSWVLSVETTFFIKVLCISIATLRLSLAHRDDVLSMNIIMCFNSSQHH